tara:strand:+ start:1903 stop:2028 length:126 start_codon:yes stop_codon:yes gene_type:complete
MGKQNTPPPAIDVTNMGWEQSAARMGTGTRPTIVQEKLKKK